MLRLELSASEWMALLAIATAGVIILTAVAYTASEKEIIRLVEQSHLPARRALQQIGIPRSTFIDGAIYNGPEGQRLWTIAALARSGVERNRKQELGSKGVR